MSGLYHVFHFKEQSDIYCEIIKFCGGSISVEFVALIHINILHKLIY